MISAKIQSMLQQICDSYGIVVNSDDLPVTPFCVHDEKLNTTLRTKEGVYAYEYDLGILIVGDSDAMLNPVVASVISALEGFSDSIIDNASLESSTGLQYDIDNHKFHNQLNFKVVTFNL